MKVRDSWYQPYTTLAFIWAIVILLMLWLPPSELAGHSVLPFNGADKFIHAFLFATLYFLCAKAYVEHDLNFSKVYLMTFVMIYSGFTELIQLLIVDRSFEFTDMMANAIGVVAAHVITNHLQN